VVAHDPVQHGGLRLAPCVHDTANQLGTIRATRAAHPAQPRHVPCQRRRRGISTIFYPATDARHPAEPDTPGRSRTLLLTDLTSTRRCEGGFTPPEKAYPEGVDRADHNEGTRGT